MLNNRSHGNLDCISQVRIVLNILIRMEVKRVQIESSREFGKAKVRNQKSARFQCVARNVTSANNR